MTLYERIYRLCRERGIEISNLGREAGIKVEKSTISKWKSGAVPRIGTVRAIADYFDVSVDFLMGTEEEDGVPMEKPNSSPYGYKSGKLPVIGVASAGKGVFAEQDIIEWMEAPADCCNEDHFWVKIVGASMEPDIFNGDYVLIRRQEELDNGNIGLFVIADEGFCKRYRHEEGVTELISSNPSFPPMRFVNGRQNIVRIIGRVIRLNRTL